MTPIWQLPVASVAARLEVDLDTGLSNAGAAERQQRHGRNELVAAAPVSAWHRLAQQFRDPLVVLLLIAIAISVGAWLSDGASGTPLEAIVIAAIVVLNAVIGFWQEAKAIEAVAALQRLAGTHSTVLREGAVHSIPSTELVPGDVLLLAEGDAVGADCRIVESASLEVVEAPLTGESEAVAKRTEPVDGGAELVDRFDMAFSGTAVSRGRGRGIVVAIGSETEIGRIAALLEATGEERTPLQQQIDWLGKMLGIAVVVLASIVVGAIVLTSDVSTASGLLEALLVGVSLAVAAVPEGLPAILTVVLALGVQRMAGQHAIVKRLMSVETLGSASVICTDKTGTLTRNEMTIVRVVTASADAELTGIGYEPVGTLSVDGHPATDRAGIEEIELVLGAGSLANDASIRLDADGLWEVIGDPTEIAFLVAERKLGVQDRRVGQSDRVAEVPFDSDRKLMTTVQRGLPGATTELMIFTKGAPDVLLDRCTHERVAGEVVPLDDARRSQIAADVDRLADLALRTLAVAYRPLSGLDDPVDESIERDLIHLGVVGIIDPPRPEARVAIEEARAAGIRVVMITGDHPRTAERIGEQLGIHAGSVGVSGRELSAVDDERFGAIVEECGVFARVAPEHKLRIVETLQQQGHIVAMTGDGVNDAPALKQADIGVAMGINGTEVSKEAADMILADDNFATILLAVREGREIFADIRKFLRYLLASNTGEVLVMVVGVLAAGLFGLTEAAGAEGGLAVPLLATQILWINLLTDSALALALGVDPAVENVMEDPPRGLTDRIIDRSMMVTIVLIGAVTALAGLVALDLELAGGMLGGSGDIETARTMLFTTIVLAQIFNAFNSRSDRVSAFVRPFDNRLLWAAVAVTVALQVAVVHLPFLNRAFDTVPLDIGRWAICAALSTSVLVADELRKLIGRARS